MTERTYRVLTFNGDVVTEVQAESIEEAAYVTETMGYSVIDTMEPDVVVVHD